MLIAKVAIPSPLRRLFDYLIPKPYTDIPAGTRVLVPFSNRSLVGVVIECSNTSSIPEAKLKTITAVLDLQPSFPDLLLKLMLWSSQYYHHPLGDIIFTGLPAGLRKKTENTEPGAKRAKKINPKAIECKKSKPLALNTEQLTAVTQVTANKNVFQVFLLNGVTGSGKTEVYLQIMDNFLQAAACAQILFLVPEISLTPQTITRIQERFSVEVLSFHSHITDKNRLNVWVRTKDTISLIVIGTRSALFLPFSNLQLIIIDEEHDNSFKQANGFRYHARDLAIMRAKYSNIPLVLGSATPSFETMTNVSAKKYIELVLSKRAGIALPPKIEIFDIRHKKLIGGLCAQLIAKIKDHLKHNGQVLLFLNRRGYAPAFMCFACGHVVSCTRCDAKLTTHLEDHKLICHHCNKQQSIPTTCSKCSSKDLNPIGVGTERIEEVLSATFKDVALVRIDSDNARRKGSMESMLDSINNGTAKLLIGTQMLAKGHHFSNVTLVAIIDTDASLFSTDFRAMEKMGQLITQVAGRAGRESTQGEVVLQTHHPEHPLLQKLIYEGYFSFSEELLQERKQIPLPPYSYLAMLRAEAKKPINAQQLLQASVTKLRSLSQEIQIMGPVPAPMAKRNGNYRMQLLLNSTNRVTLHNALNHLTSFLETTDLGKKARWSLDVDPIDTL